MTLNKKLSLFNITLFAALISFSNIALAQMKVSLCFDARYNRFCSDQSTPSDFENSTNGNLNYGSYGSSGYGPMDQVNQYVQSRMAVPQAIKNDMRDMEKAIDDDITGKFDEAIKSAFADMQNMMNGVLQLQFLPASLIPPPIPSQIDKPILRKDIQDFYEQTKTNQFTKTKEKVNETIRKQAQDPNNPETKFWWNEVRRNHTDSNGILKSLPYQDLNTVKFSADLESPEGQYIRQEFNNALANHASSSFQYLKECEQNGNCGISSERIAPVMLSNGLLQSLEQSIKIVDENEAWGYDSGNLPNLISSLNQAGQSFTTNNPNPSAEDMAEYNSQQFFAMDGIDQEIAQVGPNVGAFVDWPTYNKPSFSNDTEQSEYDSAQMAKCIASFNLCRMTGEYDQLMQNNVPDLNGSTDPDFVKTITKEQQILDLMGVRSRIENINAAGIPNGEALKNMSRFATLASTTMAINGNLQESDQYKAIAEEIIDVALGFTPIISVGKDAYELFTGKNLVTGKPLSTTDRVLAAVGLLTLGTGDKLFKGAKLLGKGLSAFANSSVMKAASNGASVAIQAAKKAGLYTGEAVREFTDLGFRVIKNEIGAVGDLSKLADAKMVRHGPINPGRLNDISVGDGRSVADTFRSSSYFKTDIQEPVKLYRTYGGNAGQLSKYYSRVKPTGPGQAVLDSALDPAWGNTSQKWVEITVPPGETFYEGIVSEIHLLSQNSNASIGQILGGGSQVYIDKKVPAKWITDGGDF